MLTPFLGPTFLGLTSSPAPVATTARVSRRRRATEKVRGWPPRGTPSIHRGMWWARPAAARRWRVVCQPGLEARWSAPTAHQRGDRPQRCISMGWSASGAWASHRSPAMHAGAGASGPVAARSGSSAPRLGWQRGHGKHSVREKEDGEKVGFGYC